MSVYSMPLRTALLATTLSLSILFAAPAQAFSDDEARRAILELAGTNQAAYRTEPHRHGFSLQTSLRPYSTKWPVCAGKLEQLRMKPELDKTG